MLHVIEGGQGHLQSPYYVQSGLIKAWKSWPRLALHNLEVFFYLKKKELQKFTEVIAVERSSLNPKNYIRITKGLLV